MERIEQTISQALDSFKDDRYKLALAVAKRAKQLTAGEPNLLDIDTRKMKYLDIALLELAEGKINLEGFIEVKK